LSWASTKDPAHESVLGSELFTIAGKFARTSLYDRIPDELCRTREVPSAPSGHNCENVTVRPSSKLLVAVTSFVFDGPTVQLTWIAEYAPRIGSVPRNDLESVFTRSPCFWEAHSPFANAATGEQRKTTRCWCVRIGPPVSGSHWTDNECTGIFEARLARIRPNSDLLHISTPQH
jgi:hypothetical protein